MKYLRPLKCCDLISIPTSRRGCLCFIYVLPCVGSGLGTEPIPRPRGFTDFL
jgi:hypothetical protein